MTRRPLRDSIGVTDASPLRSVRMRNNFEHFDERLDRWWRESPAHVMCDMNIGPSGGFAQFEPHEMFRSFDPVTAQLEFWGESFNVRELIAEIERILPKLREEASKPHWVT